MDPRLAKFLLDENVPSRLKAPLESIGLRVTTLKGEGMVGSGNGTLSEFIKKMDFILITRDKDFTFLWKKYEIRVIYLALHPHNRLADQKA